MGNIESHRPASRSGQRSKWVFPGFLAVALFFLWTEHRAHLLGILPYLIFLACPLMHLFHHGHGHGHGHGGQPAGPDAPQKQEDRHAS